ncbi:unnamed protein product [Polarella glacialis]|uniref:Reverse transcriptase Ty1/copia-type domain-containing protein n=1 Tax=Polarella glacialis TaxID=89957 RepID=A0A813EKI5_POLGL|nr:unnamed protein product [Polarella glacialis]
MKFVGDTWKCTGVHSIDDPEGLSFCGITITRTADSGGIRLSQQNYVQSMLQRHDLMQANPCPVLFDKDECYLAAKLEDPNNVNPVHVRDAQAITGELLFASTRTRPDISYPVNRMASLTAKEPQRAIRMGMRVLKYLLATTEVGLFYPDKENTEAIQAQSEIKLDAHWSINDVVSYTDISFAPEGEKSHGAFAAVWCACPVFWKNGKQAFPVHSTCEAELIEATEGQIAAEAVRSLIHELFHDVFQTIAVDNTASIALLTGDGAPWRTRHLRIRSAVLRDRYKKELINILHAPGRFQLADFLTKTFPAPRIVELREMWLLRYIVDNNNPKAKRATTTTTTNNNIAGTIKLTVAALMPTVSTAQVAVFQPDGFLTEALGERMRSTLDGFAVLFGLFAIAYAVWKTWKTAGFAHKYGFQAAVCYVLGIYFDKECLTDAPPPTTATTTTAGEVVVACDRRGVLTKESS